MLLSNCVWLQLVLLKKHLKLLERHKNTKTRNPLLQNWTPLTNRCLLYKGEQTEKYQKMLKLKQFVEKLI